ncbi:MAG: tripartite tricarboxylate transporter permease [Atribacterota bacterium]|nr:tripartite tricarboxylate transporter permease [Atribacterota bacterium]
MWNELINGIWIVLSIKHLIYMTFGVAAGIAVGATPGLTSSMGVALLIPITFSMPATTGLILLGSMYVGSVYGGSISAILIGIPGTPASIATSFDGHVMVKNGEADMALRTSISASTVGGIIGALCLIFIAPPLAKIALSFGPDEYFWVAVFGLTIIISIASKNPIKGFISAALGFFVGTIGMDPVIGNTRFTFGSTELIGGIDVVVLLIGLFSIPQALSMVETGDIKASYSIEKRNKMATFVDVWKDIKEHSWVTYLRSSILGTIIGIIPGAGGSIASYLGYNEAKRWSKRPELFGTGIAEGVAASEAANNAVIGGAMVPLLTLGVPGNNVSAILIGGLMIQGLRPGPMLFVQNPDVVYSFMFSLLFANFVMLFLGYYGANFFVNIVKIPNNILAPSIITLSMIGSYAIRNSFFDVGLMIFFGFLGYLMKKVNISFAPAVLALILGPIAESNIRRAFQISNGSVSILFSSMLDWILISLSIISIFFALVIFIKDRRQSKIYVK